MKPTFKQFLEDIEVDDDAYHPYDAEKTVQAHQVSLERDKKTWQKLPAKFPEPGFSILWRKINLRSYDLVLVDERRIAKDQLPFGFTHLASSDPRVAVHLSLETNDIELPTGAIDGMITNVLSGNKLYRGSGIASMLYETLVRSGQVLFSSNTQTTGGKSNWIKLTNRLDGEFDIGVIMDRYDAEDHVRLYSGLNSKLIDTLRSETKDESLKRGNAYDIFDLMSEKHEGRWLAVGDIEALQALAYKGSQSFFIIAPKGTFDKHLKYAIQA